jgi:hypothetical protein
MCSCMVLWIMCHFKNLVYSHDSPVTPNEIIHSGQEAKSNKLWFMKASWYYYSLWEDRKKQNRSTETGED